MMDPKDYSKINPTETSSKKRRIAIIVGMTVIILLCIGLLIGFNAARNSTPRQDQAVKPLTIGAQPYVYICSMATKEEYARLFALDDPKVGTVSERSALPLNDIKAGGDLTKLAPGSSPEAGFSSDCSYSLARKGATQISRIDIEMTQFATVEQATERLQTARDVASGAYLKDDSPSLPALQLFSKEKSYFKKPDKGLDNIEAGFVVGSRFVELNYGMTNADRLDAVTASLGKYAKTIEAKLKSDDKGKPIDLTGTQTSFNTKFIDICRQVDLQKISKTFRDIEFRPDEMTDISTYGSLKGSRAAANGVESNCLINFNTSEDRVAVASLKKDKDSSSRSKRALSADARWPHTMTISLQTLKNVSETKAVFEAKRTRAQEPIGGSTTDVQKVANVGDDAYTLTRETDISLEKLGGGIDKRLITEHALVVLLGKDIIVVSLQQSSNDDEYQKKPLAMTLGQQKDAFAIVRDAVEQYRGR